MVNTGLPFLLSGAPDQMFLTLNVVEEAATADISRLPEHFGLSQSRRRWPLEVQA